MPQAHPDRTVHCVKLDQELPALERAPFPTPLGDEILEKVSKQAWDQWLTESVRIINTYRVDLGSKQGTEFMIEQLKIWLGFVEGELKPTAWTPEEGEASQSNPGESE